MQVDANSCWGSKIGTDAVHHHFRSRLVAEDMLCGGNILLCKFE